MNTQQDGQDESGEWSGQGYFRFLDMVPDDLVCLAGDESLQCPRIQKRRTRRRRRTKARKNSLERTQKVSTGINILKQ